MMSPGWIVHNYWGRGRFGYWATQPPMQVPGHSLSPPHNNTTPKPTPFRTRIFAYCAAATAPIALPLPPEGAAPPSPLSSLHSNCKKTLPLPLAPCSSATQLIGHAHFTTVGDAVASKLMVAVHSGSWNWTASQFAISDRQHSDRWAVSLLPPIGTAHAQCAITIIPLRAHC